MNILLVDDDTGILETMDDILTTLQYNVETAHSGCEALRLIKTNRIHYNFILMDMKMPEMDGIETSEKILAIHPKEQIFMISAYISPEMKSRANKAGIKTLLNKPIDLDNLQRLLKRKSVIK